ncbi:MAG: hypothetical protein JXR22_03510 [Prolixibacteraceae bacterium]|nr:hypothetical protein [Prolixibacteraceae bacterium]
MKTNTLSIFILLAITLFSCENIVTPELSDTDTNELVLKSAEIAENDILIESVSDEFVVEAEFFAEMEGLLKQLARVKGGKNLMEGHQGMRYHDGFGPAVSVDTAETGYPVVITLDYGEGVELRNGRIITGLVSIELSAQRGTDGAIRTITYSNCTIDSVGINGVVTETFNGDLLTIRTVNSISAVTFVMADGTVIEREGTHTRNWLAGLDTPEERDDDVIEITGSVTAQTSSGNTWARNIVEALIRTGDCRHHVQGVVEISQNGTLLASLNFGDGACDNLATMTVNGETIEIELQDRKPKANVEKYRSQGKRN